MDTEANSTPYFVVKWIETESFQPALACRNRAAEAECKTLIEALSIFHLETETANYKRVSELGYTPSENEFRQRVTYLAVLAVYDEGTILEEKASEYYYIDD